MFKFNFSKEDYSNEEKEEQEERREEVSEKWIESKIISLEHLKETTKNIAKVSNHLTYSKNTISIKYISLKDTKELMSNSDQLFEFIEKEHSDLISSKYEGGFKIWECTFDLLNYLTETNYNLNEQNVLDLGCGAGLLGILALKENCSNCYFQDYNEEVLKSVTFPNVLINFEKNRNILEKCKFVSGDWSTFPKLINQIKFDVILTSETIYNESNYEKLFRLFKNTLKPNGKIYLGAKSYYFGVGGNIANFEHFLKAKNIFQINLVWKNTSGLIREILEIKFL